VENLTSASPGGTGVLAVISVLETQLATLDGLGSHIAAAHLDAAIQQLRLDLAQG
jgi:hypothetical protein